MASAELCESLRVVAERRVHGSQETAELLHLVAWRGDKVRTGCPVFAHVVEQLPQRLSSRAVEGQDDRVGLHEQELRRVARRADELCCELDDEGDKREYG